MTAAKQSNTLGTDHIAKKYRASTATANGTLKKTRPTDCVFQMQTQQKKKIKTKGGKKINERFRHLASSSGKTRKTTTKRKKKQRRGQTRRTQPNWIREISRIMFLFVFFQATTVYISDIREKGSWGRRSWGEVDYTLR